MDDAKGKWVISAVLLWAALAQIAPEIFQLRSGQMMWQFLFSPSMSWILLAIAGIYIVFRLDSIDPWPRRKFAAEELVILPTPNGVNVYRVRGGASVRLDLDVVSFLRGDIHLDSLMLRLDSTVENCQADPQSIPGLKVTRIAVTSSLTEDQAKTILEGGSIKVNGSVTTSRRRSAKTTRGFTISGVPVRDGGYLG